MAEINGCTLPGDLLYHVSNNQWLKDMGDGTYRLGMTDIAQSMAGNVIHCRIKKAGKGVRGGKSLATVESGKWVGPVKAPFDCTVLDTNDAVEADATLLNKSPYNLGWIVRIQPANEAEALGTLRSADDSIEHFKAYMAENDFELCVHCEGFDASS